MSPRRRRSSQTLSIAVVIGLLILLWYEGKLPGLPKPQTVAPTLQSLSKYVPNGEAIRTLIPNIPGESSSAPRTPQSAPASSVGGLPEISEKPQPQSSTFQGCPPEGDGGDTQSNFLKNRVDDGNYVPVSFDAVASLTWPKDVEKRDRVDWSAEDRVTIAHHEGIPVMVEGYLTAATESGPESTNCHGTSNDMVDWHVSLVKNPGEDRSKAIVTETTPRVRTHHKWSLNLLRQVIADQERVRISGWLFFDPEHPDHIGKYRITLWEVHPIMQIEVYRNGQWIALDDLAK